MSELAVTDLFIYPIKSLQGVRMESAKVGITGFEHDRRWMIVDSNNQFITQRKHPHMTQFKVDFDGVSIQVQHGNSQIVLSLEYGGDTQNVQIWDDSVMAVVGKSEWNEWFSEKLGFEARLVHMPESTRRGINPEWSTNDEIVSFADAYPFLIIGQESLDDLNSKIGEKLSVRRFRPNIVFSGGEAYDELVWKDMRIGEAELMGLKPCERCVLTTIDPDTGLKGKEPLQTLAKQKINNKVVFGQHAVPRSFATIKTGDTIKILSKKESAYAPL